MTARSPFHEGEQAVQDRLGVRQDIEPWARRVVRGFLPDEHRRFYQALPFLVAAARDGNGRPWATLLADAPGFVSSPDDQTLVISAAPAPGDALDGELEMGADVGLLGIEFSTRRRNRVNGRVVGLQRGGLTLAVDQAFGNCPQYIHEREWEPAAPAATPQVEPSRVLSPDQRAWLGSADTFFIATGHRGEGESEAFGMDASHRGGNPGFVHVESDRRIVFPDYAGNNHYNTIGNLELDPRVGLLFVDFEGGHMLQISGRAQIDWDSPAVAEVPGARRLVAVDIDRVVELREALPMRWRGDGDTTRSLRVTRKVRESDDVTSFHFEPRDGGELPDFEPGQHLPIELDTTEGEARRTYSLSSAPDSHGYRITVKREPAGLVSRWLHEQVHEGDIITSRAPAGDFVLHPGARPVVLVSAGVGITPMVSMLEVLADRHDNRHVLFVHGARDGRHHPLADEVRGLAARRPGLRSHASYSRPDPGDVKGRDYDREGRVDADLILSLSGQADVDVYMCGPMGFMAELQRGLEALGVPPEQIHSESFGPRS